MASKCDKCGKLVPDGEASCPHCGTKIEMDNLAVGCLFVLGLIGLFYLVFRYWQVIILVAAFLLVAGICYAVSSIPYKSHAETQRAQRDQKKN